MASAAQDTLLEFFLKISGEQVKSLNPIVSAGRELAGSLEDVVREIRTNLTQSVSGSKQQPAQSTGESVLETLEAVGKTVVTNALGAAPLIRGIISLFGGGDSAVTAPELPRFALPPAIRFGAAETANGGFSSVDYDQAGSPRIVQRTQAGMPVLQGAVTVNVQAMDARSFLDRSTEIAAAVREAMLNLNSINDVVNDL